MELYGISDKDLNEMTDDEEAYLNKLYQIYYFIQEDNDISDWSTKKMEACDWSIKRMKASGWSLIVTCTLCLRDQSGQ